MKDLVVVIVLNYNQNEYTLMCLESLLGSDYINLKIMLIDNGSDEINFSDLINKMPKSNNLIIKRIKKNIGYAQGTNYGLKEGAKMEPNYFLIMNNDTVIDRNAIKELVNTCKAFNDKAIVTGKVYDYISPNKLQLVGYKYISKKYMIYERMGFDEIDNNQYDKVEERIMIDDVFVLHPIAVYKKLGGYTNYLWINGVNVDLALRAKKEGFKLIYTPKAKLWHKGSVTIGGRSMNPKLAYWSVQSSLILRYLHLKRPYFLIYYIMILSSVLRTFLKSKFIRYNRGVEMNQYALAKYQGLKYFNNWVFDKKINTGENPF